MLCPRYTYRAFTHLPTRYQNLSEAEARLSYDEPSLLALAALCRQSDPELHRAAWNLLLLSGARIFVRYLKTEEPGDLYRWLAEAIAKKQSPLSYVRRAVGHAQASRAAEVRRDEDHAQEVKDSGALFVAHEGEGHTWASQPPASDPILRKQLQAALSRLSTTQRRVFLLTEVEELTAAEVAALLKTSEATVYTRLKEARKKLRQVLAEVSANPSGKP